MQRTFAAVVCLGSLLVSLYPTQGEEGTTVISVVGKVWQKENQAPRWRNIEAGDTLPATVWVKTGAESQVRLVTSEGAIISVAANQKREIAPGGPQGAQSLGNRFFVVLSEVFSSKKKQLQASSVSELTEAARGGGAVGPQPLAAAGPQVEVAVPPQPLAAGGAAAGPQVEAAATTGPLGGAPGDGFFYEGEWQALIGLKRIPPEDFERVLRVAGYYYEPAFRNRAVALISRLSADYPDNEGFASMARQAWAAFGEPSAMSVRGYFSGGSHGLRNGSRLRAGEGLRAEYLSRSESYLYAFLHFRPRRGGSKTVRIHPTGKGPGRAIAAAMPVLLPEGGNNGLSDLPEGRIVLWAWACTAPLAERAVLREAVRRAETAIASRGHLSEEAARRAAPSPCGQAFAFWYDRV